MEEFLGEFLVRYGAYVALFVVLGAVAWGIRRARGARDLRALPEQDARVELLAQVRRMRREGESYDACLSFLRGRGLRSGVASSLIHDVEREQEADVGRPEAGVWRGYRFEYPGNWKIAPLFEEEGADAGISIEGLGSAMIVLIPAADGATYGNVLREQAKQLRDPERTALTRWGVLEGEGVRLSGAHRKMKARTEIEVFQPADATPAFVLVQCHTAEEAELVLPGFHLVGQTFRTVPG